MKNKILIISLIFLSVLSIGFVVGEVIYFDCNEDDPLVKFDLKLKYLSGKMNPSSFGVEPFSEEGGRLATFLNNYRKECLDKW